MEKPDHDVYQQPPHVVVVMQGEAAVTLHVYAPGIAEEQEKKTTKRRPALPFFDVPGAWYLMSLANILWAFRGGGCPGPFRGSIPLPMPIECDALHFLLT